MTEDSPGWLTPAIRGLARVPAYLLIFVLAVAPSVTGVRPMVTIVSLVIAAVVVAIVELGKRRQIQAATPLQAQRLAGLPGRETAVRTVLEGIVAPDADVHFLYASASVTGYERLDGRPTKFPFGERDLRVTPVLDAQGLAYVHSLINLAQKSSEHLQIITSHQWLDEYWKDNLILVGSPNANNQTATAAELYGCPYRFNDDVTAILEGDGGPGHQWPDTEDQLAQEDFALLAKLKRRTASGTDLTYLIIAGIGPTGTLSACYYLWENIVQLAEGFGSAPFAAVLRVDRRVGFLSVKEVTPLKELAVQPA